MIKSKNKLIYERSLRVLITKAANRLNPPSLVIMKFMTVQCNNFPLCNCNFPSEIFLEKETSVGLSGKERKSQASSRDLSASMKQRKMISSLFTCRQEKILFSSILDKRFFRGGEEILSRKTK